jgi:hypothetical protein
MDGTTSSFFGVASMNGFSSNVFSFWGKNWHPDKTKHVIQKYSKNKLYLTLKPPFWLLKLKDN